MEIDTEEDHGVKKKDAIAKRLKYQLCLTLGLSTHVMHFTEMKFLSHK